MSQILNLASFPVDAMYFPQRETLIDVTGEDKCDGCALFYNMNKISLLSHHSVEFCQPNVSVLDRDNVAVMAKFQHKNKFEQGFQSQVRRSGFF